VAVTAVVAVVELAVVDSVEGSGVVMRAELSRIVVDVAAEVWGVVEGSQILKAGVVDVKRPTSVHKGKKTHQKVEKQNILYVTQILIWTLDAVPLSQFIKIQK
jgi:hypothetical protein